METSTTHSPSTGSTASTGSAASESSTGTHASARASGPARGARKTTTATKPKPRGAKTGRVEADHVGRTEHTSASTSESPFLSIDAEMLADLQDVASRKIRAIVREKPIVALGGAFAGGFILGGGWRTRVGRFMMLAGARYLVVQAAERYFSV